MFSLSIWEDELKSPKLKKIWSQDVIINEDKTYFKNLFIKTFLQTSVKPQLNPITNSKIDILHEEKVDTRWKRKEKLWQYIFINKRLIQDERGKRNYD